MGSYRQFCPVAKAAEILAERWTPLGWVNADVGPSDVDPGLLMWDMRRRIHRDRLPAGRVAVQFDFRASARNPAS